MPVSFQRRTLAACVVGLIAVLVPAQSFAGQTTLDSATVMETVARLKPGEFIWAPEVSPSGPVLVIVSLATQRAIVYRNGLPIGITTVSTGKPGHETPTGLFTILEKEIDHRSSLYDDAPMPYMQRLTWGGVALHAGNLPGYAASHGCIRLPGDFAKLLYGVTRLGFTVVVTNEPALPRVAPTPDAGHPTASEIEESGLAGPTFWAPERSPSGPVSIIISTADRQLIVLRNGREIGAAAVRIRGPVAKTEVYSLRAKGVEGFRWAKLPMTDAEANMTEGPVDDLPAIPDDFQRQISDILAPGTTLLVTNDSLAKTGSRRAFVIGTADRP